MYEAHFFPFCRNDTTNKHSAHSILMPLLFIMGQMLVTFQNTNAASFKPKPKQRQKQSFNYTKFFGFCFVVSFIFIIFW